MPAMAPVSPVGSAPASPRFQAASRGPGPGGHRPGRAAGLARLEVDRAFPRSARGALKIARTVRPGAAPRPAASPGPALTPSPPVPQLVALATLICFAASGAHEAYRALAGMETVITILFLLLYLLRLDTRMRCLFWPLAVSTRGLRVPGCSACECWWL